MEPYGDPRIRLEPASSNDVLAGVRRFVCESPAGWNATGVAAVGQAAPAVRSIEVRPADPAGEVTASLFRRVSIGLIVAGIQKQLEADDARRLGVESLDEVPCFTAEELAEESATIKLPLAEGYVRMTDALLRRVAEEYLRATAPGEPPRALQRLADTFGRPQETVRTWVSRARKDGWLGQGVRGRAGAGPGPRLMGYRAHEEGILRGAAVESPGGQIQRTRVQVDPDGVGGTIMRDTIPADGPILTEEIERTDDWRKYVDALEGEDG